MGKSVTMELLTLANAHSSVELGVLKCCCTEGVELFDNFEELITDTALKKWDHVAHNVDQADRDLNHFNAAMENFYLKHVDKESRGVMFACFDSNKVHKPVESSVQGHAN